MALHPRPRLLLALLAAALVCLGCQAAAYATDLSGTLAADTTLTRALSPYNLTGPVTVPAGVTLTVEPGVTVIAQGSHRVYASGVLQANGTAALPIVFRAANTTARGAWQGLYVGGGGSLTATYMTVKNSITNVTAFQAALELHNCNLLLSSEDGLMAFGATALTAQETHFDNNARHGLYLEGYEVTGAVSDCDFRLNGSYPVQLKATEAEMLQTGNEYVGNGLQRVGVSCSLSSDIADDDTWLAQDVDYDTSAGGGEHTLTVAAAGRLTLARGVGVRGSSLEVLGRLQAFGEAGNLCRLTSPAVSPARGDWEGVVFRPGSLGTLNWLELGEAQTGLTSDGAQVTVTNCLVRDCQYDGVRATGGADLHLRFTRVVNCGRDGLRLEGTSLTGVVKGCSFADNDGYPVWAMAANVWLLRNLNTFTGNGRQVIGVSCAEDPDLASGTHTWATQPLPLDCTANPLGGTLNVGPAATLVISPDLTVLSAGVSVSGRLEVRGTSSRPVRFGPATAAPQPGDWTGLAMTDATGDLAGAVIEYAETGLSLTDSSPTIRESVITRGEYDGLRCRGNSRPVVTTTQLVANARHGVFIENASSPNLGDLTSPATTDDGRNRLAGNGGYEVYNGTANAIRAHSNWWASADPAAIAARIYDETENSSLGPVLFGPFLGGTPNAAPVLTWVKLAGYFTDGVDPEVGTPSALFRFKVRYTDAEGSPPAYARLHVADDGVEIAGSPFAMDRGALTDYVKGVTYLRNLSLEADRDLSYWFSASDGENTAVGTPTAPRAGPLVNTPPTLAWVGEGGWTNDGVHPGSGVAGSTVLRFRVRYQDADGDPPTAILCHILRGGTPIAGSPFAMTAIAGDDFSLGVVHEYHRRLSATGLYAYRFEASDGLAPAGGPPTAETDGPTVTAATTALVVTNLSSRQVRGGGVEVSWNLTAAAHVIIRVTNLAGREVAVPLAGGLRPAGSGGLWWSGRGASGAPVPAGTYLVVGEFRCADGQTQRLVTPVRVSR